jgi:hypothetical protein
MTSPRTRWLRNGSSQGRAGSIKAVDGARGLVTSAKNLSRVLPICKSISDQIRQVKADFELVLLVPG